MIHFATHTDTVSPILLNNGPMAYYLSEFLNRDLDHLYAVICKNMKHVDELYAGAQKAMKQTPQHNNI